MSRLDDVVCLGIGIVSGGGAGVLADHVIQSSQKYTSFSRIALDVFAGLVSLVVTTGLCYTIRDLLFYEKKVDVDDKSVGGSLGGYDDVTTTTTITDKRTGEIVYYDRSWSGGKVTNR